MRPSEAQPGSSCMGGGPLNLMRMDAQKQSTVVLGRDVEESLACRGWCSPHLTGCLSLSDKRG